MGAVLVEADSREGRMRCRIALGLVVACVSFAAAGIAAGARSGQDDVRENRSVEAAESPPQGITGLLDARTEEDRLRNLEVTPPEQRLAYLAVEEMMAQDMIRVGGPDGFLGWVNRTDLARPSLPESEADLFPVYGIDGSVVAYFGVGIGAIDKELVEAPGEIDLEAEMAKKGITVFSGEQ